MARIYRKQSKPDITADMLEETMAGGLPNSIGEKLEAYAELGGYEVIPNSFFEEPQPISTYTNIGAAGFPLRLEDLAQKTKRESELDRAFKRIKNMVNNPSDGMKNNRNTFKDIEQDIIEDLFNPEFSYYGEMLNNAIRNDNDRNWSIFNKWKKDKKRSDVCKDMIKAIEENEDRAYEIYNKGRLEDCKNRIK